MDGKLFMNLWLKVNSIGSGLSASQNFKYALTISLFVLSNNTK